MLLAIIGLISDCLERFRCPHATGRWRQLQPGQAEFAGHGTHNLALEATLPELLEELDGAREVPG